MSSNSPTRAPPNEVFFRNANGKRLILKEKASLNLSSADNIINFSLRGEKYFNVNLCLALFCATLIVWFVLSRTLIPLVVSVCVLTLGCKSFITSAKQDTLLVVESVGVHIESKQIVYILNRECGNFIITTFLSWNMIEDVFINEVIKGQRVLYYLTFIIKESSGRQDSRKLVPLFQDLLPE